MRCARNSRELSGVSMLVKFWKRHFLGCDLVLSLFLIVCFYAVSCWYSLEDGLMGLVRGNRSALYTLVASISGSLLGFTFTGITILLALADNKKLGILTMSPHYSYIYKVYIRTIWVLAVATIVGLVALVMDKDDSPCCIFLYLNLWLIILICFRLYRCLWILENIIKIALTKKEPIQLEEEGNEQG